MEAGCCCCRFVLRKPLRAPVIALRSSPAGWDSACGSMRPVTPPGDLSVTFDSASDNAGGGGGGGGGATGDVTTLMEGGGTGGGGGGGG